MPDHLPEPGHPGTPILSADGDGVSLRFDDGTLHSRMLHADPVRLVLEYTRLVMGFLLFQPEPARIAMIGLGGGSIAKYCARHLPEAEFTAVEISPAVIAMRDAFGIPPDGPRFHVRCEDGAEFVRRDLVPLDVLVVDGFDAAGHSDDLCSPAFYDRCHACLADGGVLVANLYADDSGFGRRVDRIWESFAGKIAVVTAGESDNAIVFAGTRAPFPPPFATLVERRRALAAAHPVDLDVTLRKIVAYGGHDRQPGGGRVNGRRHGKRRGSRRI